MKVRITLTVGQLATARAALLYQAAHMSSFNHTGLQRIAADATALADALLQLDCLQVEYVRDAATPLPRPDGVHLVEDADVLTFRQVSPPVDYAALCNSCGYRLSEGSHGPGECV